MQEYAHYFIPETSRGDVAFDRHIFFSLEHGYDYLRVSCSKKFILNNEEFSLNRGVKILNTLNRLGLLTISEGIVEKDEVEKINY